MSEAVKDDSVSPPSDGAGGTDQPDKNELETLRNLKDKLLSEKKKVQEKLDAVLAEKSEREKKEMEEKGEFKKLAEAERVAREAAENKLKELEAARTQGKKLRALITALDAGVDEKFYDFLPIEAIAIDPDSGEINQTSVAQAAENFKKQYPELLKVKPGVKMPAGGTPPGNGGTTITRSEWLKLSSKEMLKYKPNQIV